MLHEGHRPLYGKKTRNRITPVSGYVRIVPYHWPTNRTTTFHDVWHLILLNLVQSNLLHPPSYHMSSHEHLVGNGVDWFERT
jgi:hypothetical protein